MREQEPTLVALAVALFVSGSLILMVLFLHLWQDIPIGDLTRDPNAVSDHPPFTGFLSQVGFFFWSAGAAVCLFERPRVCSRRLVWSLKKPAKITAFFAAGGFITLMLTIDDAFLVHESLLPHFAIPEEIAYGTYMSLVFAFLVYFSRTMLTSDFWVLAFALSFYAGSILADDIEFPFEMTEYLVEDSAKIIGIVGWPAISS